MGPSFKKPIPGPRNNRWKWKPNNP